MRKQISGGRDVSQEWEYCVETLGNIWRGPSSQELEDLLNGAASEGWELVTAFSLANSNRILAIFRREKSTRTRRRRAAWP